jgi:hypothetical protein
MSQPPVPDVELFWYAAPVQCRICSHLWAAVWPEDLEADLECPRCGFMAGEPLLDGAATDSEDSERV